ncbi:MAG TPA: amidohydrolase family protein [Caulobacteraceae bacterium]|jgi:cytosine/adenosine deaminase-related metal-dependent hydrolase|nr:amidohydrolase family protein [Caulobacteraceae bacterium]
MSEVQPILADLLISGATLVTVDAGRRVILDGALALKGDRIVAVGKRADVAPRVQAKETLEASRFVATPGFIDAHIHITGDPITRGFPRGGKDVSWGDKLQKWVIPLFKAQTPAEEAIAARCAALAMMRRGTTTFVEAGTVTHLDAVMEGLDGAGIRGRVGGWVEGRAYDPSADASAVAGAAIRQLQEQTERWPDRGGRLCAWPLLVGHSTNPDEVWRAAKELADENGLRVSAHMSPRAGDPEWFLGRYNRRPLEHLADIGVMGESVMLTHLADIDQSELDILVASGAGAIHCPHAALQGGFGVSRIGLFPEMLARGVRLMMGTDGLAADILGSARLFASLFRDARADQELISPGEVLELATVNPAAAMGLDIGALEVGRKADIVLHDAHRPEWGGPVFDVVDQLAFAAPADGVHSVWIDGAKVIEAGRATLFDEDDLLAQARAAGAAVVARTGLPLRTTWPTI